MFADEVEMVSIRTAVGSIGVLANHAPLLAILEPTELLVLVEEAIAPEDIDRGAFESRLKEARDVLERSEEESEERLRAEREVKRYEAFLKVDSGS